MFRDILVAHDALTFLEDEKSRPRYNFRLNESQDNPNAYTPESDIFEHYRGIANKNVTVYPKSREEAGSAFWSVLHHHAAAFPNKPSQRKRKYTRIFIKEWLKAFPCGACREDAEEYVKVHRPQLRTRKTYAQWQEDFHNWVNRKTGKQFTKLEIHDGAHDSCPTCSLKAHDSTGFTPEEKAELHTANVEGVEKYFDKIKDASKRVLYELADKTGVSRPNIVFGSCPESPFGSCTIASINDGGNNSATIYLNPEQFSPRTLAHEFYHYHRAMKGDSKDFANEKEAEEFALKVLNEHFDFDDSIGGGKEEEPVAHDTRRTARDIPQQQPAFVDNFEFIYKPFAGDTVTSKMLNNAHTPEILGYSLNAIESMFLSPLGMVFTNIVTGLAFTGAAMLSGNDLAVRDKQLLLEVGAHQAWSFIPFVVDNKPMVAGAARMGESLQRGDIGGAFQALLSGGSSVMSAQETQKPVATQQQTHAHEASVSIPSPQPSYTARRFSM